MPTNEEHDEGTLVQDVLGLLQSRFEALSQSQDYSPDETTRRGGSLCRHAGITVHPLIKAGVVQIGELPQDLLYEPVHEEYIGDIPTPGGGRTPYLEQIPRYGLWWIVMVACLGKQSDQTHVRPNDSILGELDNLYGRYFAEPIHMISLPTSSESPVFWPLFLSASVEATGFYIRSSALAVSLDSSLHGLLETMRNVLSDDSGGDPETGQTRSSTDSSPPDDLIPFTIACQDYDVSRPTLQRKVDDGTLQSFRRRAASGAPHLVSRAAVENLYPRRPSAP